MFYGTNYIALYIIRNKLVGCIIKSFSGALMQSNAVALVIHKD